MPWASTARCVRYFMQLSFRNARISGQARIISGSTSGNSLKSTLPRSTAARRTGSDNNQGSCTAEDKRSNTWSTTLNGGTIPKALEPAVETSENQEHLREANEVIVRSVEERRTTTDSERAARRVQTRKQSRQTGNFGGSYLRDNWFTEHANLSTGLSIPKTTKLRTRVGSW